ncbi:clavin precursor [Pisolithus marmoratus]|nr:clavin precursor [Pisolithus marmoratus]
MQLTKSFVCLALAVAPALGVPTDLASAQPEVGPGQQAADAFACKNTHGDFHISAKHAKDNVLAAPPVAGSTGFPHPFANYDEIPFHNARCKHHGVSLLEFPVYPDGHLYPFDQHPKQDPGPARVVYTAHKKEICGVIAHPDGEMGHYRLCN